MKKPTKPEVKLVDVSLLIEALSNVVNTSVNNSDADQIRKTAFSRFGKMSIADMSQIVGAKHKKFLSENMTDLKVHAEIPDYSDFAIEANENDDQKLAGVLKLTSDSIKRYVYADLVKQGVIFSGTVSELIHQQSVFEMYQKTIDAEEMSALDNLIMGHGLYGAFVYIPDNTHITDTFLIQMDPTAVNGFYPYQFFMYVGKSSSAKVIIEILPNSDKKSRACVLNKLNVIVDQNGTLDLFNYQHGDDKLLMFSKEQSKLAENARYNSYHLDKGGRLIDRIIKVDLEGKGGNALVTGIYSPGEQQAFFYDTEQKHLASHTTSDLLFKGVIDKAGYAWWKGNILVAEGTVATNGYQANNNLMLEETAKVESIPGLEILANDVRCSHGVTMGDIDREQLFYLQSRGIDTKQAEQLIVEGFLNSTLTRVGDKVLVREISEKIFT